MTRIDREAALSGIDSYRLMVSAGSAVAAAALRHYPQARRFVILCGPGNNGGDGYVAAATLRESGANIDVHALGDTANLKGDAATAFAAFGGDVPPLEALSLQNGDVIIDALFGAGLSRSVSEAVRGVITAATTQSIPIIAVDLPSGIDGRTGAILGSAFRASHTITFVCRKPGHLLLPGRTHCGKTEVVDIGIPARIVKSIANPALCENGPHLWQNHAVSLDASSHKFRRGHLTVFSGGPLSTGAARLAAMAGQKAGAGLVTIAAPTAALSANAAHLTAIMLHELDDEAALSRWLDDPRHGTFVLGPGFGDLDKARRYALALKVRKLVLDADGITAFKGDPGLLFDAFAEGDPRLVMTPHEGEFGRLFPDLAEQSRLSKVDKAVEAARRSHAVIVYKGADTVIAAPDGRAAINTNAPPWLATAGAGDTLAGIIGAHLAQSMPAFEAAAAGVTGRQDRKRVRG